MSDRAFQIHYAKVLLAQARHFRTRQPHNRNFCFALLAWAAKARRNAMAMREPVQGSLL